MHAELCILSDVCIMELPDMCTMNIIQTYAIVMTQLSHRLRELSTNNEEKSIEKVIDLSVFSTSHD